MKTRVLAATASYPREQSLGCLDKRQPRRITFNGKPLTGRQQWYLERMELSLGLRLPDHDYWCDPLELWDSPIAEAREKTCGAVRR